jgi:hypothetical protein
MTEARRASNEHWPSWLHEAGQRERDAPGSLQSSFVSTNGDRLELVFQNYKQEILWGEWLVQEIDGTIHVYSSDLFDDSFLEDNPIDRTKCYHTK